MVVEDFKVLIECANECVETSRVAFAGWKTLLCVSPLTERRLGKARGYCGTVLFDELWERHGQ